MAGLDHLPEGTLGLPGESAPLDSWPNPRVGSVLSRVHLLFGYRGRPQRGFLLVGSGKMPTRKLPQVPSKLAQSSSWTPKEAMLVGLSMDKPRISPKALILGPEAPGSGLSKPGCLEGT